MTRLPLLTYDETDERQRVLWDDIVASRGGALSIVDPEGGLAGPFAAFVRRPHIGEHLIKVGAAIRFDSALPTHLLELAITTVGARWRSEFEFWAHSGLALKAGISQAIIDSLAEGEEPTFDDHDQATIYRFAWELSMTGHVEPGLYDAAIEAVGVDGVVDLTQTIGYYSQISFVLNTFDVALPPGVTPVFD